MSARVLLHARHTAREVSDAVARAWPNLLFLLYRERHNGFEEALLASDEKLKEGSDDTLTLEGKMTGREVNDAFRRAFGVLVEFSVESGRSVMNTPLDSAK
jgi:hypothetical protein